MYFSLVRIVVLLQRRVEALARDHMSSSVRITVGMVGQVRERLG